jgi:hypothetical protein
VRALWILVDVSAVLIAVAILVIGFPGRVARRFRNNLLDRVKAQSKASPRRDSSSKA